MPEPMDEESTPRGILSVRKDEPLRPRANPIKSAIAEQARVSRGLYAPVPGSIEYYEEKYPGFPPYVHEAFSIQAKEGTEAVQRFIREIEKPGLETSVDEIDPVTKEVVSRKVVVNWF